MTEGKVVLQYTSKRTQVIFDFNKMFSDLLTHPVFSKHKDYVYQWKKIILSLSKKTVKKLPKEYFEYAYNINGQNFIFHFDIEYINLVINRTNLKHHNINIKNFGENDQMILYTKESYKKYHLESKEPIIICPLVHVKSDYIVVDGNHRVTAKIDSNMLFIETYVFYPITSDCFNSDLEYAVYLLCNEILYVSQCISNGEKYDEVVERSNINTFSYLLS